MLDIELNKRGNFVLAGTLIDSESNEPIDGATITVKNNDNKEVQTYTTSSKGDFDHLLDNKFGEEINYDIVTERDGYLPKTLTYTRRLEKGGVHSINDDDAFDFSLVKIAEDVDLGIALNPILWDLNSSVLNDPSKNELDKIVQIMNGNPELEVELGSHTDSRSSDHYNQWLSNRRAKRAAEYIQQRISNPGRISGKGYGETKLLNRCRDGVCCSEEEHQQNRRTEFRVIKMKDVSE